MNVILEFINAGIDSSLASSLKSPLVKAFMDDLFLMSPSLIQTQKLLNRAVKALSWGRMALKASKSKTLVINDGEVLEHCALSVCVSQNMQPIPSITQNPVRFLGRSISVTLNDKESKESLIEALAKSLKLINNSKHRGVHKLWIMQHLLIPRLRWPLLIYEIPVSLVHKLEQKISTYIRKWLRLHNSTSNICLYFSLSPCPLPIKSLSSVAKSAKVSGHLLLRESNDPYVASADVKLKSGKWNVAEAVSDAEKHLEDSRLPPTT